MHPPLLPRTLPPRNDRRMDHRPIAHLLPESGWTNDPIGPVHWRGRTHLFSQVNPDGAVWARPHWGHFTSDDLVHWRRRPIALSPDPDGPDVDGCYSGTITVADGEATMFYTGARGPEGSQVQTTCVARSRDDHLDTWVKDPSNPVVTAPADVPDDGFRDPFVWREGDGWRQLVGASLPGVGGSALLYASTDLRHWDYVGPILTAADLSAAGWTGEMWECPALLRGTDGDALLISVHDSKGRTFHAAAIVGHFDGRRFHAAEVQRFDHGPDLYAPCLYRAPDGRVIVWGWSWEARTEQAQRDAGWAGVLTLPRVVDVVDGRVTMAPLPEVDRLRTGTASFTPEATEDGWLARGAEGDAVDLLLRVPAATEQAEVRVRRSSDGVERTTIGIDRRARQVWVDRDHASQDPAATGGRYVAPLPARADGGGNGAVELRVLVDRSIVEVFVGGEVSLTTRIYPSRPDSTGIEVVGVPAHEASALRAFTLGSVWAHDAQARDAVSDR